MSTAAVHLTMSELAMTVWPDVKPGHVQSDVRPGHEQSEYSLINTQKRKRMQYITVYTCACCGKATTVCGILLLNEAVPAPGFRTAKHAATTLGAKSTTLWPPQGCLP